MWPASPAHAARTGHAATGRCFAAAFAVGCPRGEYRKLLFQFDRTAVGTFRALPVLRTQLAFTVALAFFAMEFVNRHAVNLIRHQENLKSPMGKSQKYGVKKIRNKLFSPF